MFKIKYVKIQNIGKISVVKKFSNKQTNVPIDKFSSSNYFNVGTANRLNTGVIGSAAVTYTFSFNGARNPKTKGFHQTFSIDRHEEAIHKWICCII